MNARRSNCPICKAESVQQYRPFCSKRCADVDLGKWVAGSYTLPSEEPPTEEELLRAIDAEKD